MTQIFSIMNRSHLDSNPDEAFVWSEEDTDSGYEKYGFLYRASILDCLIEIEEYLCVDEDGDDTFNISIDVGDKYGGNSVITSLEELSAAKLRYSQFALK